MKRNLGLGALCATMLISSCSGDKKEEAAIQEPTLDPIAWTDTLTTTGLSGAVRYMDVQSYNTAGQLQLVETYLPKKDATLYLGEKIFMKDGNKVLSKTYDEAGKEDGLTTFTYTPDGKLSEELVKEFNAEKQEMVNSIQYKYNYNEAGDLTSLVESKFVNLRWMPDYEWEYTYDAQGRMTDRKDFATEGKERKQSAWFSYTYNDQNQCTSRDTYKFDIKGGKLKHDAKSEFTYNKAGQVVSELVIRHKANQKREPINSRLFEYVYTDAGQLSFISTKRWRDNKWNEVGTRSMNFDEQGRLSSDITVRQEGKKSDSFISLSYVYGAPADKVQPTAAAEAATCKPVVNYLDKMAVSAEEE